MPACRPARLLAGLPACPPAGEDTRFKILTQRVDFLARQIAAQKWELRKEMADRTAALRKQIKVLKTTKAKAKKTTKAKKAMKAMKAKKTTKAKAMKAKR